MRKVIVTDGAPKAIGPYSQAIEVDGWLFLSGQIPIDPATGALVEGSIAEKTRRVLTNIQAVLEAAGATLSDVVICRVYLKDIGEFSAFNQEYAKFFPTDPPARATIEVPRLPKDASIEIECQARRKSSP